MTTGVFYPGAIPRSEVWRALPVIGGEMELAVLAVIGALRGAPRRGDLHGRRQR